MQKHTVVNILMFLQISCYPCGAILLTTKGIWSKRMRRLVNVKVDYKLGERYMPYPGLRSNVECFSLW